MASQAQTPGRFTQIAPGLPVPDVQSAADYYRDRFGFVITDLMDHFAMLKRDDVTVLLWRGKARGSMSQRDENPGLSDVAIWVNDVDMIHAELVAKDVAVLEQPEDFPYGLRHAMYRDLNDYIILTSGPILGDGS